jgi:hypothetical protein
MPSLINLNYLYKNLYKIGQNILFYILLLIFCILLMPIENAPKFIMTFLFNFLAFLLIKKISERSDYFEVCILIIFFILIGDFLQLFGMFSKYFEYYKYLVNFEELSNIERESEIGILSMRYYGFFAEPSYHGVFSGLLCAIVWYSSRVKSIFYGMVLYALCPTPMMILAFFSGILLWGFGHPKILFKKPIYLIGIGLAVFLLLAITFMDRIMGLLLGAEAILNGELVNTSETVRLVYPLVAAVVHLTSYGIFPESINCIENASCIPEALKFPLATYFIFFGLMGLFLIMYFLNFLYRINKKIILVVMIIASILSGGGGYILQFSLILSFLLTMPNILSSRIND